jgi:hypothetical protein
MKTITIPEIINRPGELPVHTGRILTGKIMKTKTVNGRKIVSVHWCDGTWTEETLA